VGHIASKNYKLKDGQTAVIRTVNVSDAEAFLRLGKSIMSEQIFSLTQPEELTLTLEQEQKWLESNIQNENHLIIVAEVSENIVGQLDFSNGHKKRNAHTGEFGMGVHKDYRGLGIGSLLLSALIEWTKNHPNIEKVNLCVHSTNDRAIAMYKKHGFQMEGLRTKDLKYQNNTYVDTVLMGLTVK
jgi:RimJ/RimL family protein N-acetyltransferase